jgi:16S rRNA (guanine966-N2)-methyltransferase
MRVVAGSAGGIPLQVPRNDIRPTMDRVKAAIFSSLGGKTVNARVLDLFAGCGALGIEALSRGCASAAFVESNPQAVESIERNLVKTKLEGAIHEMDVFRFLDRVSAPRSYDVIFADPPYAKKKGGRDFTSELLHSEHLRAALAEDGIFVLEKMPGSKMDTSAGWECVRSKKYGSTEVVFLRSNAAS